MMRSSLLLSLQSGLLLGLVLNGNVASAENRPTHPNIVLMMGDDHGWDETGYNGHPWLKTPVLDQMAASGLRLDRFYSAHPTCSPTRGSVLTGRHPNRYGTFEPNYSIRPQEITIAQLLKEAGYRCAHIGKWHLGPVKIDSPTSPGRMGFDEWLSHDNFFELDPVLSRNGAEPQKIKGESSEILIEEAIHFVERSRKQTPFFLVIWFGSPHEPYSGLPADLALYDDMVNQYPGETVSLTSNETGKPTKRPLGEVLRERYAEITAMDRAIGQFRESLREQQLAENTLLWYCGDNGSPSGASTTTPLRGQKATHYEGGTRVPGIIEYPALISKPAHSSLNSVTSDILPTLVELTGLKLPERPLDGVSLMPLIRGEEMRRPPIFFWSFDTSADQQKEPVFSAVEQEGTTPLVKMMAGRYTRNFTNFQHPQIVPGDYRGTRVILDGNYKLIVSENPKSDESVQEFYQLEEDPAETQNLAETQPEQTAKLARELLDWQSSVLKSLTGGDYQ